MVENKTLEHLPEVRAAVAALSPEDREVLAAVQVSPFKLTAPEQFKEFAANIDYFVFEPNIHDLNDLGWRYLAQHMDMLTFWTSRKKELTKKMAADLLKKGRTNVKGMWSEKKQATYDAAVILDDTGGKYINFKLEFPKRKVGADGRK